MKKVAFPGSFDPPTFGHIDIIERASAVFDELIVVIAEDRTKNYMFDAEERCVLIQKLCSKFKNVSVCICPADLLFIDFLKEKNINIIVRGIRNAADLAKEGELAVINKMLDSSESKDSKIETFFLISNPEFSVISSSSVRIIASYNGNLKNFVPDVVEQAVLKKIGLKYENKI